MAILTGDSSANTLTGTSGDDTLSGLGGNDTLNGSSGLDTFTGGTGNDTLSGDDSGYDSYADTYIFNLGDGQDTITSGYTYGNPGLDTIQFGAGIAIGDIRLSYNGVDGHLIIKINGTTDQITLQNYFLNGTLYRNVSNIIVNGTTYNLGTLVDATTFTIDGDGSANSLTGTPVVDIINGLGGNDTLSGYAGNDTLNGGDGNDTLYGNTNNDTLVGGAGDDSLNGNTESDTITGGTGNDTLSGDDNGYDYYADTYIFNLGDGQDIITSGYTSGNVGLDTIQFGAGIAIGDINLAYNGIDGHLILKINGNTDQITLQNYFLNGTLYRNVSNIIVNGTTYNLGTLVDATTFTINGDGNANSLTGTPVVDIINGLGGNDTLSGYAGNDTLDGGDGNDTLYGNTNNDTLVGGAGDDSLNGNTESDTITGGTGNDTLSGDDNGYDYYADTYIFNLGDGQDIITSGYTSGNVGLDTIQFGAGIAIGDINLSYNGIDGHLILKINGTNDQITLQNYFLNGTLYRNVSNIIVNGTTYNLGTLVDATTFTINGDGNANSLTGTPVVDIINGLGGNDTLSGYAGNDTLDGGDGNDTLYGNTNNDTLVGGAGDDSLNGNTESDTFTGGTGNDTLSGDDSGYDYYADTYIFNLGDGQDLITSAYTSGALGKDTIEFGAGIAIGDISVSYPGSGSDLIIHIANTTDQITLQNYFYNNGSNYRGVSNIVVGGTTYDLVTLVAATQFTIAGDANANSLTGTQYGDVINGLGGNDTLYGYASNDTLNGGDGNDTLYGNTEADTLEGGKGNDYLAGDDTYDYAADTYVFNLGDGQDTIASTYNSGLPGKDTIQFGAGIFIGDIVLSTTGVDSNLTIKINGTTDQITINDYLYNDNYRGVLNLIVNGETVNLAGLVASSVFTINGDANANSLSGKQFVDVINGLGGNDTLYGYANNDTLNGGDGNDTLYGNTDSDTLVGGAGNDYLAGDDTYDYAVDTYVFNLGDGQDTIASTYNSGVPGKDIIQFTSGILASDIKLSTTGTDSNLTIKINGTTDQITINDFLYSAAYQGVLSIVVDGTTINLADLVASTVFTINGDANANSLSGKQYVDVINGLGGNDTLYGYGNTDTLNGGDGNDTLYGNTEADTLVGGAGNDYLAGDDTYDYAADTYVFNIGDGQDTIASTYNNNVPGKDTIQFGAGIVQNDLRFYTTGVDSNLTIKMNGLVIGNTDQITINDYMFSAAYKGVLNVIVDGSTIDLATFLAASTITVQGDVNNNSLTGTQYADAVIGLAGNDAMTGQVGNDSLNGGSGDDSYTGNAGVDTFIVDVKDNDTANNTDTIQDFTNGTDFIQLQSNGNKLTIEQVTNMLAGSDTSIGTVADNGIDTTFTFANGSFLILKNTLKSFLTVDDFVTGAAVVNSAPTGTASASLVAGSEDIAYVVSAANLLQGFTDANGDTLSVSNLTTNHGSVVDNGNGTFTITPTANYNGAVTLSYHVIDGNTGSIAATQTVNLAAVNDAPTGSATAVLVAGTENIAYTFSLANLVAGFSDVDGNTLSVSTVTSNHGAVVNNGNGTFTLTPASNYSGAVTFSYNVIDGNGGSVAATQTINLVHINLAPTGTATLALNNGTEDVAYTVSQSALLSGFSDPEGNTLSVTNITSNHGTVVNSGSNNFTVTPTANYNGLVTLSYTVIDGLGGSIAATQTFTLVPVNDAPTGTATATLIAGTEDVAYTVSTANLIAGFSDAEGNTLSVSGLTSNHGAVTSNGDGTFTITPSANYNGVVTLNYNVIDGNFGSIAGSRTFNLSAVNDAPTGSASAVLVNGNEDLAYNVTLANLVAGFSDIDGNTLSITNLASNHGTVVDNGNNTFTITPTADYSGVVALTYNVIDGNGGSVAANQSYTITNVNDAPKGAPTTVLVAGTEDVSYSVSTANLIAGFTDAEGNTLSVSNLVSDHGTVVVNGNGTFTITHAANYNGAVILSYNVIDGNGGSIAATRSFTVAAVNDAPTGAPTAVLVAGTEDAPYLFTQASLIAGFSDIEGNTLSVSGLSSNHGTVVNNLNGTFTLTPSANYNGLVTFTYNVIDGNGGSIASTRTFNLAAVNDAPIGVANAVLVAGAEDVAYTVTLANLVKGFSDVDGNTLSISNLASNHGAVVNNGNGTFTITPTANYSGAVILTYNVLDGNGGTIAATQTYNIVASNDAPSGAPTATLVNGTEDVSYTVSASNLMAGFSDVDGDVIAVSNLLSNHGSVVNNNNGTFTITHAANYNGLVTLSYNVIDGKGGSIAATRSFTLAATNDAPTGSPTTIIAAGTEDVAFSVTTANLIAGFSDIEGDTLSIANLTSNHGTIVNNGNGTFTINHSANYNGAVTISYSVIDGNGGSASATRTFTLASVRDDLILNGTSGADTLVGDAIDPASLDTLSGLGGNDKLLGLAGNDILDGGDGDDSLDGGAGNDKLTGGLGNDTYIVDSATDVVSETSALISEIDSVKSSITYVLGANLENLTLTGGAANGTGNSLDNIITGNDSANILDGGLGIDKLSGGLGNDTYLVDNDGDTVTETSALLTEIDTVKSSVTFTLGANIERLTLIGTAEIKGSGNNLANILIGNSAANTLNGGAGADTMTGGLSNDKYYVDNIGDKVIETSTLASEKDTVNSTITYILGSNVENLTLTGSAAINGTGNALSNVLVGNSNVNILTGGAGSDAYYINNTNDTVIETSTSIIDIDTVNSTVSFVLSANIERLNLTGAVNIDGTGNDLANIITGNMANNILNGGAGIDVLTGGTGNDTYIVDNIADIVSETSVISTEIDVVKTTVDYTLTDNVENIELLGGSAINGTGNNLANTLLGNSASNILTGGVGNDSISGGAGADVLIGGLGNDSITVDNSLDIVTEFINEGTDIVYSSANFTLSANIEKIVLVGAANLNTVGNELNNQLTGNTGANILNGAAGNDLIFGGLGADIMIGGAGNDIFYVDNIADVVTENINEGTDTISASISYVLLNNSENLILIGDSAINATGNNSANTIKGNSASNIIIGGAGADGMFGYGGADIFDFNALTEMGKGSGKDNIKDFNSVDGDKLDFSTIDANTTLAGNQAFNFVTDFSTTQGEIRFADGVLYLNTDTDINAEYEIQLTGVTALTVADVIL